MNRLRTRVMLTLLFSTIAATAFAQTTLGGRVTDPDRAAVADVPVTLTPIPTGARVTTRTQNDGTFAFPRLAPGRYQLEINAPGFAAWTEDVTLDASARTVDASLQIATLSEDVTVRANAIISSIGKTAAPLRDQPITVNRITADYIQSQGINDLVVALQSVGNVNSWNQYGVYEVLHVPRLLGLGAAGRWHPQRGEPRPHAAVERRVDRDSQGTGVGPLRQRRRRRHGEHRAQEAVAAARLRIRRLGRQLEDRAQRVRRDRAAGQRRAALPLRLRVRFIRQLPPRSLGQVQRHPDRLLASRAARSVRLPLQPEPEQPQRRRWNSAGRPGPTAASSSPTSRASAATTRRTTSRCRTTRTSAARIRIPFPTASASGTSSPAGCSTTRYWVAESLRTTYPSTVNRTFLYFKHKRRPWENQSEFTGLFKAGVSHDLLAGWDYQDYSTRTTRADAASVATTPIDLYNPVETTTLHPAFAPTRYDYTDATTNAFYVQDQLTLTSKLKAVVGLRFDHIDRDTHNNPVANGVETAVAPVNRISNKSTNRSGLVYQPINQLDLYGQYATSFRPNFNLQPDGSTLEPEYGGQLEIGQRARLFQDRITVNTAVFRIVKRNVTFSRPGGVFEQVGKVRSQGVEIDTDTRLSQKMRLSLGYGYTNATYLDYRTSLTTDLSGNKRPRVPPHSFNAMSYLQREQPAHAHRQRAGQGRAVPERSEHAHAGRLYPGQPGRIVRVPAPAVHLQREQRVGPLLLRVDAGQYPVLSGRAAPHDAHGAGAMSATRLTLVKRLTSLWFLDWRKVLVYTHRWLGIAGCVLFIGWFISGVVMMYARMPGLANEERLARAPALDLSASRCRRPKPPTSSASRPTASRLACAAVGRCTGTAAGRGQTIVFADTATIRRHGSQTRRCRSARRYAPASRRTRSDTTAT